MSGRRDARWQRGRVRAERDRHPPQLRRDQDLLEQVDRPLPEVLAAAIARRASAHYHLTDREAEAVAWFIDGRDLASFLVHAGLSRSTFKSHRTSILAKTGEASLEMLASRLLRDELDSSGASPAPPPPSTPIAASVPPSVSVNPPELPHLRVYADVPACPDNIENAWIYYWQGRAFSSIAPRTFSAPLPNRCE